MKHKSLERRQPRQLKAVTLIELLVVVLIIGILSTIATGIYTGEVQRARITATKDLINQLEMAITRYEVDTGTLPPSGSGTEFPPDDDGSGALTGRRDGSGYLQAALVHSLSGNALDPASSLWKGPYINLQNDQLGATSGPIEAGNIDVLDPWGGPIVYVKAADYNRASGEFTGGGRLFTGPVPGNTNPDLPQPNPYAALGETFYNTNTYQLISYGPNGSTLNVSGGPIGNINFKGAEADDITNFGY